MRRLAVAVLLGLLTPAGSAVLCGWKCAQTESAAAARRPDAGCHQAQPAGADLQLADAGDVACHDRLDGAPSVLAGRPAPILPAAALTHQPSALPDSAAPQRLYDQLRLFDPPQRSALVTPLRI